MPDLLRLRNFRLLLAGQSLTMFGDVALLLVLAVWVKDLTDSNSAAGLVFLLIALPGIVAPLGGLIVDRFPRRRIMIVSDIASGIVMLSLLFVRGEGDIWIIYAVAVYYGASQQIFFAARSGLMVSMLPEDQLGAANGLLESIRQGLRIIGPLFGAALYAFIGGGAVAVVDSATFFLSATFLLALRVSDLDVAGVRDRSVGFIKEVSAGVKHIFAVPELRRVVLATLLAVTTLGMLEGAVFLALVEALGKPPEFVGVLGTAQGAGAIVGGLSAGWLLTRSNETRLVALGILGCAIGFGLQATVDLAVVLVASGILGVAVSYFHVGYFTLLQRRTGLELQGRVFAAAEALIGVPFALSIGAGAVLVSLVDFRLLYALNGATLGVIGVLLYLEPGGATQRPAESTSPAVAAASPGD
ncbi:MAG: MFS transporter [Dehalococcoidia bacterium]